MEILLVRGVCDIYMKEKYLIRYLVLIGILLLCAAAAWSRFGKAERTGGNAVLVKCGKIQAVEGTLIKRSGDSV